MRRTTPELIEANRVAAQTASLARFRHLHKESADRLEEYEALLADLSTRMVAATKQLQRMQRTPTRRMKVGSK